MSEIPSNITLLLLQIILQRQQVLAHNDKSLNLDDLLVEPIIDNIVLESFKQHKLTKLYAPDTAAEVNLRRLKAIVTDIFQKGIQPPLETVKQEAKRDSPDDNGTQLPVTVITLANYYYERRIQELEKQALPRLQEEIVDLLRT